MSVCGSPLDLRWRASLPPPQIVEYENFLATKRGGLKKSEWNVPLENRSNTDRSGTYINVVRGLRRTTDQPRNASQEVIILGGSTVFCAETQDADTLPSWVQRHLGHANLSLRVWNYGVPGATAIDRVQVVHEITRTHAMDFSHLTCVFYLGVNECFNGYQGSVVYGGLPSKILLWFHTRLNDMTSSRLVVRLALAIPRALTGLAQRALGRRGVLATIRRTVRMLDQLRQDLDGSVIVVIQPSLYTWRQDAVVQHQDSAVHDYLLRQRGSLRFALSVGYREIRRCARSRPWIVDGSAWLDDQTTPIYVDWVHLNAAGNREIGRRLASLVRDSHQGGD